MENNPLLWDLIDLASQLRQERLFVISEQSQLAKLNQEVICASSKLAHLAWVTSEQRRNLNKLVLSCPEATPSLCCRKASSLQSTQFVDANKVLGYQDVISYGELFSTLRDSPQLISRCLVAGDRLLPDEMPGIVHSIVSGLYTNCLLPQDKVNILRLLSHLITLQLLPSETPRRLLKQGSCAFARLYSTFHEGLFSAKVFLTAALHSPITQLLMLEERYMDIDPEKAIMRYTTEERFKRFGTPGTDAYKEELQKQKTWATDNLVSLTKIFIASIQDNLHCFPSSIWWLVGQIYARLTNNNCVQEKEVFAMCTDLVFTLFICPAIVTPEPYGITDAPISPVTRYNLMQVAQTLQILAMYKYQPIDPKVAELYCNFEKDCVSSIIDSMLEDSIVTEDPPIVDCVKLVGLSKPAALFTLAELHSFISFLRTVANEVSTDDDKTKKELSTLLSQIPAEISNGHNKNVMLLSPEKPSSRKTNILSKSISASKSAKNSPFGLENGTSDDDEVSVDKVLVLPFDYNSIDSTIGLISEQKILDLEKEGEIERNVQVALQIDRAERLEGQEKRTRFSLSHDDGSIGNTSDNLEVVSEAPSNHSVASSLELETEDQNDNLSDMVSANVSGRGSPNISGRDTPSSQMTEGDDIAGGGGREVIPPRPPLGDFNPRVTPPPPIKASRFDLDDKFGKFEIKTLIEGADETVSLVSDTWSTDVLASDSETVEAVQAQTTQPPILLDQTITTQQQLVDLSETASEAWSTDVVASDSERLTEIDTDDTASVARSDDTGRSEIDAREEQEVVDEVNASVGSRGGNLGPEVRGSPSRSETARRRTLEFVDSNRNSAFTVKPTPISGASLSVASSNTSGLGTSNTISETGGGGSVMRAVVGAAMGLPPPPPSSDLSSPACISQSSSHHHRISFRSASHPATSQEVADELDGVRGEASSGISGFSTASIASSSSSGSSSEPRHANPELSLTSLRLLTPNGTVMGDSSQKLSSSGGAIPKSISFDKTAERGDKESQEEEGKHKKSFFKSFKLSFRNRRGKAFRSTDVFEQISSDIDGVSSVRIRRGMSEEVRSYRNVSEISDDILAKYRRKPTADAGAVNAECKAKPPAAVLEPQQHQSQSRDPYGRALPFNDAKKKLRLVLSNAEIQQVPDSIPAMRRSWLQKENELVAFLQLQLAEAINLQDRNMIPQLHETLRCVRNFSERECRNIVESLKEEYKTRSTYISYLVKCRQSLLQTLSHLEKLSDQVKCDQQVVLEFLTAVCVRFFIERRESQLNKFISEFQSLTLADEKCDFIETFFQQLSAEIDRDPLWQYASDEQLSYAQIAIERFLFSRVYFHAMYPNGDGDISRDQVLHDHMSKLAKIITPDHKDLRIPKMYHYECPWLSAQAELSQIAAYRTPRDKLHCALRCISNITKLLSLSCVPMADDLTPVLVYVLIMANPTSLLSTVEFVSTFYGSRLEGEEQYYWTTFCSAIEFIKTMDYGL